MTLNVVLQISTTSVTQLEEFIALLFIKVNIAQFVAYLLQNFVEDSAATEMEVFKK